MTYPSEGGPNAQTFTEFQTVMPAFAEPGLEQLLDAQGAVINARPMQESPPWWMTLLLSFGPTLLLIGGFL